MSEEPILKPVIWVGSSRNDLREFPGLVQDHMGYALYLAQCGEKHRDAKALRGFGGAIAAITLTLWKKGENFDAEKLKSQAA